MKIFVVLALCLASASAGPLIPLMPLAELDGRITNGDLAREGQFPYQVGLSLVFGDSGAWCGGTLISDSWIVTAAHCADGADGATAYLGALKIREEEKGQHRIYVGKKNIFVHENWDSASLTNDIALIKLPIKMEFNDRVRPATLPKISNKYETYAGEDAFASGWGRDSDASQSVSPVLRYVEMPIMTKTRCNTFWLGMVTDYMICMSTKDGRSTCNGDSGGPLVYKDGDVNYLIGATSFGLALGCEKGYPAVFTRITSYLDWIEKVSGVANR